MAVVFSATADELGSSELAAAPVPESSEKWFYVLELSEASRVLMVKFSYSMMIVVVAQHMLRRVSV